MAPGDAADAPESTLTLISYDAGGFQERQLEDASELPAALEGEGVHWLTVAGANEGVLREVAETVGLHPLALDEVVNPGQRPAVEEYGDHLVVLLRMLLVRNLPVPTSAATSEKDNLDELKAKVALMGKVARRGRRKRKEQEAENGAPPSAEELRGEEDDPNRLRTTQLALVLKGNLVVAFLEPASDPFDALRERLREGHGTVRERGADFLVYRLVDVVIDQYFTVVESYGDNLEELEDEILLQPTHAAFRHVNTLRRDISSVRRAIWPMREVMARLARPEAPFIEEDTLTYMRDAHNHVMQVSETLEVLRETITGLHDIYLTALNTRMNDVIKVLTIISTIFIPLSFLAGLYGMNFEQPEYAWPWAYPALLLLMLVLSLAMLWLFRRKGWL